MRTQEIRNCQSCGYSLAGLLGGLCPECGHDQVEMTRFAVIQSRLNRSVLSGIAFGSGAFMGWLAVVLPILCDPVFRRPRGGLWALAFWLWLVFVLFGGPALAWLRTTTVIAGRAKSSRGPLLAGSMNGVWAFAWSGALVFSAFAGVLAAVWRDQSLSASPAMVGFGFGIAGASGMLRIGGGRSGGNDPVRWWTLIALGIAAPTLVVVFGQQLDEGLLRLRFEGQGWPEDKIRRAIAWSRHGHSWLRPKHPASYWFGLLPALLVFRRPVLAGLVWAGVSVGLIWLCWPCIALG